jgi:hypothetical protein
VKVEYEFDPFAIAGVDGDALTAAQRKEALDEIVDFLLESVRLDVAESRSPVTGRAFKGLNKDYKALKEEEGGTPVPNLEMTGDLMDSLEIKQGKGGRLLLTVSEDQMGKADGHNNHSGDAPSWMPRRPFIPDASAGETFRPAIRDGIAEIVEALLAG